MPSFSTLHSHWEQERGDQTLVRLEVGVFRGVAVTSVPPVVCRYDFAKAGVREVVTMLHWHAHAVAHICFTTDGELYSPNYHAESSGCITGMSLTPSCNTFIVSFVSALIIIHPQLKSISIPMCPPPPPPPRHVPAVRW